MPQAAAPACSLCLWQDTFEFHRDKRRSYYRCPRCWLVFVDPAALPSALTEKTVYDQHQNDPADIGYRSFLNRLAAPLLQRLGSTPQCGLDFGCGPGPALSQMLQEAGHKMALYDPFYKPDTAVLDSRYDFVTCTEAIEHFHHPHQQWPLLLKLLKPGGWLAVMTKLVIDQAAFAHWHYKNDITHVSFFSEETFAYLAQKDGLTWERVGSDVVLLQMDIARVGDEDANWRLLSRPLRA